MRNIIAIMKTMYPPGYHHNGFVATQALERMMYGYTLLLPINQRVLSKQSKEEQYITLRKRVILRSLLYLLSTLWFISTSNV